LAPRAGQRSGDKLCGLFGFARGIEFFVLLVSGEKRHIECHHGGEQVGPSAAAKAISNVKAPVGFIVFLCPSDDFGFGANSCIMLAECGMVGQIIFQTG